jgi:hypothetical protein
MVLRGDFGIWEHLGELRGEPGFSFAQEVALVLSLACPVGERLGWGKWPEHRRPLLRDSLAEPVVLEQPESLIYLGTGNPGAGGYLRGGHERLIE